MRGGKVVRRFDAPATRGLHRITWDLRAQGTALAPLLRWAAAARRWTRRRRWSWRSRRRGGGGGEEEAPEFFGRGAGGGPLVVPGKYTVTLAKRVEGVITPLAGRRRSRWLPEGPASREDRVLLSEFSEKLARLQKALAATEEAATEARTKIEAIRRADRCHAVAAAESYASRRSGWSTRSRRSIAS